MSYWVPSLEDYDATIMKRLRQITYTDENGDQKPIYVTYFTPEHQGQEDKTKLRPAIVVYLYDQVHDFKREQSILSQYVSDTPTDITLTEVPTPMKFFYQFTVITDYKQHMNEITRQLNYLFPTRGFITLTAPSGVKVSYDFFQRSVDNAFTHQYLQYGANKEERVFRKIFRYHLMAEVEEYLPNTYKKVLGVNHNTKEI